MTRTGEKLKSMEGKKCEKDPCESGKMEYRGNKLEHANDQDQVKKN